MRNSAIFSFVRVSDNSMVASVRIARFLEQYLDAPLIWTKDIGDHDKLDTLVIVNGAYGFSPCLSELARAILGARRVVWVQNDYTIIPPKDNGDATSPFRKAFITRRERGDVPVSFWSTCHKWSERPGSYYVNWNMLTFDENYDEKTIRNRRKSAGHSLFYYGSFRDGSGKSSRVPLFDRYFREPKVPTVISSPVDKFANRYPKCAHLGAITENFYDALGTKGLGLYIEDRKSSEEFHSPANRFYEMLSAGLPMVFSPECGSMLRKAGYDPEPYALHAGGDLKRYMASREDIGQEQRARWANLIDPRAALMAQIDDARKGALS